MRIPSQFNEDNLYRRDRRHASISGSHRRLIRLVIGLALVIVVMRQASRSEIYRPFFADLDSQLVADRAPAGSQTLEKTAIANPVADPATRRVAIAIVAELASSDQRQWMVALSQWESREPVSNIPSSVHSVRERIDSLEGMTEAERRDWNATIAALEQAAHTDQADSPLVPTSDDQSRVTAWLAALDDAAATRVVDGSVWRGGDFDAFYRYLDQADRYIERGASVVGVVPLLQQPKVFQGQLVHFRGSVARAERIDAKENVFGIAEYWQLWVRPSDGADRPLVAIVQFVPESVGMVGPDATLEEGPEVVLVGRFLKRLAYQSSLGPDLAPVVVGRLVSAPKTQTKIVVSDQADQPIGKRVLLTVLVASGIGVGLAALLVWRTSVAAKRTRQLRAAHQRGRDDFLEGLK